MNLQSRFKSQLDEMSTINPKVSYKELVKHVTATKSLISDSIKLYRKDGAYGKTFNILNKNKDRESILEAFKLVQEELNKVNV